MPDFVSVVVVPGAVFVLDVCVAETKVGEEFEVGFGQGELLDGLEGVGLVILMSLRGFDFLHDHVVCINNLLRYLLWFFRLFILIIHINRFQENRRQIIQPSQKFKYWIQLLRLILRPNRHQKWQKVVSLAQDLRKVQITGIKLIFL